MRILITGGTGFIGAPLSRRLAEKGHEVVVLSMKNEKISPDLSDYISYVPYDYGISSQLPPAFLSAFDAVVNLAGEPIFSGRWTREKKRDILSSRLYITRQIVNGLENINDQKTRTLVNASAVGYYGPTGSEKIDETAEPGDDFLANVCRRWEMEAKRAEESGVRTVLIRTGIVLGKDGGALLEMAKPYKFFLGGPIGPGDQYLSWIHLDDIVNLYIFALENPDMKGPYNATASNPVTMNEFSRVLGKVLDKPSAVRAPDFALQLLLGETATIITTGQRVIPARLSETEFTFKHTLIYPALKDIFEK